MGPIYNWDIEVGPMHDPILATSHLVLTLLRFPTCLSAVLPIASTASTASSASTARLGCARTVPSVPTGAVLRAERVVGGAGRGPARGSRVGGRVDAVVQQVQRHPLARRGAELQQRVHGAHATTDPQSAPATRGRSRPGGPAGPEAPPRGDTRPRARAEERGSPTSASSPRRRRRAGGTAGNRSPR